MNCNYKVKIKDIQNKYQFKIFCKTYDDTEIQGDIETLNSEVEALQEENLYLNNLVEQAFDKKEVEGEELSIDDTINAKMEVGLLGNTKQETTETSPSPDYPSNVNVVTGDNTIVVNGKNWLNNNFVMGTINTIGQDYTSTTRARSDYNMILGNTTYRFSSSNSNIYYVPYFYDKDKIFISYIDGWKAQSVTFTTPSNAKYVRILVKNNSTDTITLNEITQPQLKKGSTATSYEEHQEQTFQINLGNIEVCGIGDYKDYFYKSKSNNKWYLHKEIGKVVLNGSENFISAGTSGTDYRYNKTLSSLNIPNATTNNALCMANYFQNLTIKTDKKWGAFYINGNWLVFYDKDNNFENATAFNTWLSTHNTLIYYVLATPTNTEITDTTLISQLEALKTAMSYAEQTNISQVNDDIPFILQVTALASYNSRILALENAILNANRSTPVENTRKSNEVIEEPKEEVVDDNKDENIIKEEK